MELTIKIDGRQLEMEAMKACRDRLNKQMGNWVPKIRRMLQKQLRQSLMSSTTYQSLVGGVLKADFGLTNVPARLRDIISTLSENILVVSTPMKLSGNKLSGEIDIGIIMSDFSDVLGLDSALIKTKKADLPWLQWLLLQGDEIIVANYKVEYKVDKGTSRSGRAIMEKGGGWRVNSSFAGTADDNWLTRTVNSDVFINSISDIVNKVIAG